jgi:hypothetical protein
MPEIWLASCLNRRLLARSLRVILEIYGKTARVNVDRKLLLVQTEYLNVADI